MKKLIAFFTRPEFSKLRVLVVIHILLLAVFLCNGLYVEYPDEHVNLLAGKAINEGKLPYKDFFDHHLPVAWDLASGLLKVTNNNYVYFRIAWATLAFALLAGVGMYIKKRKPDMYPYYLFFQILYPFFTVYFWLHLYIADSLACLFFSMVFWLILTETWSERSRIGTLLLCSLLTFLLLFSSLTFLFVSIVLYCWQLYLVIRDHHNLRDMVVYVLFAAFPYVYYLIHLLVTGTFQDFWVSNYIYNSQYYVHVTNYTPGPHFNPFKLGGAIIKNFTDQYLPLLTKVKYFDIYLPISTLAAWSTLVLSVFLFKENKIVFLLFVFVLMFSAPRSDIVKYSESDYQVGLFLTLGLISAAVTMYRYKVIDFKDAVLNMSKNAAMVIVVLFTFFTTLFLVKNTYDKAFQRYTQFMPSISSHSFVSRFFDEIVYKGEYFWMGPYEPHHEFAVKNGMLPGKYPTLLPQFRESPYFSADFLHQFEVHPPIILVFKHSSTIFGTPADTFGRFFLDWMKGRYVTLEDLPEYHELRSPTDFNLKGELYIDVTRKDEVLKRLIDAGYVARL